MTAQLKAAQADATSRNPELRDAIFERTALLFLATGQWREATAALDQAAPSAPRKLASATIAHARGDDVRAVDAVTDALQLNAMPSLPAFARQGTWALWLLSRSGTPAATEQWFTTILSRAAAQRVGIPTALRDLMAAEVALANGQFDPTTEVVGTWNTAPDAAMFRALETLAEAHLRNRHAESAQRILEPTYSLKHRAAYDNAYWWMRCQVLLAETYQRLGRAQDAQRHAQQIRDLLTLGDPNFPLRKRVDALLKE